MDYNTFKKEKDDNEIFVMTDKMTREFKGNLLLEDRDIREP